MAADSKTICVDETNLTLGANNFESKYPDELLISQNSEQPEERFHSVRLAAPVQVNFDQASPLSLTFERKEHEPYPPTVIQAPPHIEIQSLKKSVEDGDADACFRMAQILESHIPSTKPATNFSHPREFYLDNTLHYYEIAADKGHLEACKYLTIFYLEKHPYGIKCYARFLYWAEKVIANKASTRAVQLEYILKVIQIQSQYLEGNLRFSQDDVREAAKNEDFSYNNLKKTVQRQKFNWLNRAVQSEYEHSDSMVVLGKWYEEGDGGDGHIHVDKEKAHFWYKKSAALNNYRGECLLAYFEYQQWERDPSPTKPKILSYSLKNLLAKMKAGDLAALTFFFDFANDLFYKKLVDFISETILDETIACCLIHLKNIQSEQKLKLICQNVIALLTPLYPIKNIDHQKRKKFLMDLMELAKEKNEYALAILDRIFVKNYLYGKHHGHDRNYVKPKFLEMGDDLALMGVCGIYCFSRFYKMREGDRIDRDQNYLKTHATSWFKKVIYTYSLSDSSEGIYEKESLDFYNQLFEMLHDNQNLKYDFKEVILSLIDEQPNMSINNPLLLCFLYIFCERDPLQLQSKVPLKNYEDLLVFFETAMRNNPLIFKNMKELFFESAKGTLNNIAALNQVKVEQNFAIDLSSVILARNPSWNTMSVEYPFAKYHLHLKEQWGKTQERPAQQKKEQQELCQAKALYWLKKGAEKDCKLCKAELERLKKGELKGSLDTATVPPTISGTTEQAPQALPVSETTKQPSKTMTNNNQTSNISQASNNSQAPTIVQAAQSPNSSQSTVLSLAPKVNILSAEELANRTQALKFEKWSQYKQKLAETWTEIHSFHKEISGLEDQTKSMSNNLLLQRDQLAEFYWQLRTHNDQGRYQLAVFKVEDRFNAPLAIDILDSKELRAEEVSIETESHTKLIHAVPKLEDQTEENLKKQAKAGNFQAQYQLAKFLLNNDKQPEAHTWFKKAISHKLSKIGEQYKHEFAEAEYQVAFYYRYHSNLKDKEKFNKYYPVFQRLAQSGHTLAIFELGKCYQKGIIQKPNFYLAFQTFLKAARNGCLSAEELLCEMLQTGQGVEKDDRKAFSILVHAVSNNPLLKSKLDKLIMNRWPDSFPIISTTQYYYISLYCLIQALQFEHEDEFRIIYLKTAFKMFRTLSNIEKNNPNYLMILAFFKLYGWSNDDYDLINPWCIFLQCYDKNHPLALKVWHIINSQKVSAASTSLCNLLWEFVTQEFNGLKPQFKPTDFEVDFKERDELEKQVNQLESLPQGSAASLIDWGIDYQSKKEEIKAIACFQTAAMKANIDRSFVSSFLDKWDSAAEKTRKQGIRQKFNILNLILGERYLSGGLGVGPRNTTEAYKALILAAGYEMGGKVSQNGHPLALYYLRKFAKEIPLSLLPREVGEYHLLDEIFKSDAFKLTHVPTLVKDEARPIPFYAEHLFSNAPVLIELAGLIIATINDQKLRANYKERKARLSKNLEIVLDQLVVLQCQKGILLYAVLCLHGFTIPFDLKKAFDLFTKGSALHDPIAKYYLAEMLAEGLVVPKNIKAAINLLFSALRADTELQKNEFIVCDNFNRHEKTVSFNREFPGMPNKSWNDYREPALLLLDSLLERNFDDGLAIDKPDDRAECFYLLELGFESLGEAINSLKWCHRAVQKKHVKASIKLADRCSQGIGGVSQDKIAAQKLYVFALKNRHPVALQRLVSFTGQQTVYRESVMLYKLSHQFVKDFNKVELAQLIKSFPFLEGIGCDLDAALNFQNNNDDLIRWCFFSDIIFKNILGEGLAASDTDTVKITKRELSQMRFDLAPI